MQVPLSQVMVRSTMYSSRGTQMWSFCLDVKLILLYLNIHINLPVTLARVLMTEQENLHNPLFRIRHCVNAILNDMSQCPSGLEQPTKLIERVQWDRRRTLTKS